MWFISPNPLSGIGQVVKKYASLMNGTCVQYGQPIPDNQDVFIFALPIPDMLNIYKDIKGRSKSIICMTVCETETVHPLYKKLFDIFDKVAVPSEYCKNVFSRQFPAIEFKLIYHWIPMPVPRHLLSIPDKNTFIFYNIGNFLDHRKQCKKIIEAFLRLKLPNSKLLFKATCKEDVHINLPNVFFINGLVEDKIIDSIHTQCHCYVSFSKSEGVGMGAVEAALHNKPVIITEYGGAKDYVKTPFIIDCAKQKVNVDDFLYTKDMEWGDPDFEQLMFYMKDVYDNNLRYMIHDYTKNLLKNTNIKKQITTFHH